MLAGLAWRNIWRQGHRTVLSLTSIALAGAVTIFILSLQEGTYGAMKDNTLRLFDGFAQIQAKGYAADPDLTKTIADPASLMAALQSVDGVTASAPRATSYVIASNGNRSYGAELIGVDPKRETAVSSLGRSVRDGRPLRASDMGGAVVGAALARNLKLHIGSQMTILGSARDGSIAADVLTVRGIVASGVPQIDRSVIEMHLARLQADFALGHAVNAIVVTGPHLSDVNAALPRLKALAAARGLVVRDWTELEPGLNDAILLDISFSLLLYVSLIAVVVFIILNTLLMSVLERTREFGMLLALGMRPAQIGRMVWLELLFLSGIGSFAGIALGAGITSWVGSKGIAFASAEALFAQWNMPSVLYPQLDAMSAFAGPGAIALCIVIAGIVPYLRAMGLQPVAAMRAT